MADIFSAIENLRDKQIKCGFIDAENKLYAEGFSSGWQQGRSLLRELGQMQGFLHSLMLNDPTLDEKIKRDISKVMQLIESCSQLDSSDQESIEKELSKIHTHLIHKKLKKLNDFIKPLLPLANSHLVQYISEDQWNTLLDDNLKKDLLHLSSDEINLLPTASLNVRIDKVGTSNKGDSLRALVLAIQEHQLQSMDVITSKEQHQHLCSKIFQLVCSAEASKKMFETYKNRMSEKKAHEVSIMSEFIASLCKDHNISWIVDLGTGLGYLSSSLAVYHSFNTLAIDSSTFNVKRALHRSKYDEYLCGKAQKLKTTNVQTSGNIDAAKNLIGVTKLVTQDDNILRLIESNCDMKTSSNLEKRIGLIGLHTCGSLSPISLQLFASNPSVRLLCNIGCCYHLLHEEFAIDVPYIRKRGRMGSPIIDHRYEKPELDPLHQLHSPNSQSHFPLSHCLKELKCKLGRNARMLATNATHRLPYSSKLAESNTALFWRALFQALVIDAVGSWPKNAHVGKKLGNRCKNFNEYCRKALTRINFTCQISDNHISNYYEKLKFKQNEMIRFQAFRASLGPVIEGIILLDRLAYLFENGYTNSHIVHLFDDVISPRSLAIVSYKY